MPRTLTPFERRGAVDTMTADDMRWALRYLAGHAAGPLDLALASAAVRRRRMPPEVPQEPLALERPAELGLSWPDGGDLLTLTPDAITLYPRGVDEWQMDAGEAREMAAQLAAMAEVLEPPDCPVIDITDFLDTPGGES